jgi:putative endonuclease
MYVYLLASRSRVLYTGVTNNLARRVREHRSGKGGVFTKRYRVRWLVYFECFRDARAAIAREEQIKGWRREKKLASIAAENPTWEDLAAEWEREGEPRGSLAVLGAG